MADEHPPPGAPAATITAGMLVPYQTLGPYMTLQEAVARLARHPLGLVLDDADQPLAVVTRDMLAGLLGGGKDAARAHGKMGARQQARERREGVSTTRSLISLREELPPLLTAEVGASLDELAAQARDTNAAGVLVREGGKRAGILPARALLRRPAPPPPAAPAEEPLTPATQEEKS
jgi:hypothetical protein